MITRTEKYDRLTNLLHLLEVHLVHDWSGASSESGVTDEDEEDAAERKLSFFDILPSFSNTFF